MRRYIATLFRLKELFLIPLITVPAIALIVTYYTGREYRVESKIWIDNNRYLDVLNEDNSVVRTTPASLEATTLQELLSTESFRLEVIRRSGLAQAINDGLWPVPSRLGEQVAEVPVVRSIAHAMGVVTPVGPDQAENLALDVLEKQMSVSADGNNLLVVGYTGTEPFLGKRLVEETLAYYNETVAQNQQSQSEVGLLLYQQEFDSQKARLDAANEAMRTFLELYPAPLPGQVRPASEQAELERLNAAASLERRLYEEALQRLETVRVQSLAQAEERANGFKVIDAPQVPDQPRLSAKSLVLNMIVGLTLGGMISVAGVVIVTWTDRTVRTKEDIEETVAIPLVEQVPLISSFSNKGGARVRTALADVLNPREGAAARYLGE